MSYEGGRSSKGVFVVERFEKVCGGGSGDKRFVEGIEWKIGLGIFF